MLALFCAVDLADLVRLCFLESVMPEHGTSGVGTDERMGERGRLAWTGLEIVP